MKYLMILFIFLPFLSMAKTDPTQLSSGKKKIRTLPNVEIQARLIKHNKNFLYMATQSEEIKISRKELTKEGVRQILKNKDKELTIFIPEKSIVSRTTIVRGN